MKMQHLAIVLALVMVVFAAGCGQPTPSAPPQPVAEPAGQPAPQTPAAPAGPEKHGGTLTVALAEQPSTLNPYGGMSDSKTIRHIMETLVDFNRETLEPEPLLATGWEIPNETTYIFTLREGVRFHDGTDFNADAVKAVFDYMLDETVASPRAGDFGLVESVEVLGEHQIAFHLKEPFGVFLAQLTRGYIMSPAFLRTATPEQFDTAPIGTGPFKVVKWIKDDQIVLERFDDYWDEDLPYLDRLVYKILPDHLVKVVALKTGDVDLIDNLPATEIDSLTNDPNFVFVSRPSTGYRSIYLNCESPPFNDVRLRQALAWAIDRDSMIRLATLGIGQPAYGPIAPSQWAFDPEFKPHTRDVGRAKALLAEAGLPGGFTFTIKVSTSPEEIRMAEVLQQQLDEVGITMNMLTGEYTALRSTVIAGDYEAFFVGWLGGPDPDYNMWNSFHSDGWFNWVRYKNPEVDRLLDEARQISDISRRTELYRQAQEIVATDAAMVFLKFPYFAADGQAHSKRVQDFMPDGMQLMHFKSVWVDPK